LIFGLPLIEFKEVITIELSIDGKVWSELKPIDLTTGSRISLFPEAYPLIYETSPSVMLRSPTNQYV
jgi:hypothetical protein